MNIQCKFDITDTPRTLKPEREEMELISKIVWWK
jgi:hypothetical protein